MRLGRDWAFKTAYEHLKAGRNVTFRIAGIDRKKNVPYEVSYPQFASYHTRTTYQSLYYNIRTWMSDWEKKVGPITTREWRVEER